MSSPSSSSFEDKGISGILADWSNQMIKGGFVYRDVKNSEMYLRDRLNSFAENALNAGAFDILTYCKARSPAHLKFIRDLDVDVEKVKFYTLSGITDFSVESYDMKPGLLKNAKLSKKGFAYKVVPVGKSTGADTVRSSIFETVAAKNAKIEQVKAKFLEESRSKLNSSSSKVDFRTVSSAQPKSSWTHPGVNADFSKIIEEKTDEVRSLVYEELTRLLAEEEQKLEGN